MQIIDKIRVIVSFLVISSSFFAYAKAKNNSEDIDTIPKSNINNSIKKNVEEEIEDDIMLYGTPEFVSVYFDYGFNVIHKKKTENLPHSFFGSRFLDLAICYNLSPRNYNLAVVFGIGYSASTLSFKDKKGDNEYYTLIIKEDSDKTEIAEAKGYIAVKEAPIQKLFGSYLNKNDVFLLIETKWFSNKFFPKDFFVCALGVKAYFLWTANTKIEYVQNFAKKSQTISDNINLEKLRYALYVRLSYRRVGLKYEFIFGNLFSKESNKLKGPSFKGLHKASLFFELL